METKTISVEELLRPRYKVIADYPGSPFSFGEIHQAEFMLTEEYSLKKDEDIEKFPDIFKRLEWWEGRKPSEMPHYIKGVESQKLGANDSQRFIKVKQWHIDCFVGEDGVLYTGMKYLLPASESEYLTYINSHPKS